MNVVDSSAWLSYFDNDANADFFAEPVEATEELIVPSIILVELFKHISRKFGDEKTLIYIAHITQGRVVDLDADIALDAGQLGLQYQLPLADSIIYATAKKHKAALWTQDSDFKNLPDVNYYPKS